LSIWKKRNEPLEMSLLKIKYGFAFQGDIIIIDDVFCLITRKTKQGLYKQWLGPVDPRRPVHYA
jgi:hypothetical protein